MYHTILVPLDGSKRAEKILSDVENIAHHNKSKVIFLQVIKLPYTIIDNGDYIEWQNQELLRRKKNANSYLNDLKDKFSKKGIDALTRVTEGNVVKTILQTAKGENANLLAIASHGRNGLKRVFYGSVASGVLNHIDRPILIIRSDSEK